MHSTAARESFGLRSTKISIHFAVKSGKSRNTPVMFPPGHARVAATPLVTGSVSRSSAIIGMVRVANRAACSTRGPFAMNTFAFFAMTSATGAIRAGSPSAVRATISTCAGGACPKPAGRSGALEPIGHRRLRALIYKTNSGVFQLLLSTRRDRPRRSTAKCRHKIAPLHSTDWHFGPPKWDGVETGAFKSAVKAWPFLARRVAVTLVMRAQVQRKINTPNCTSLRSP